MKIEEQVQSTIQYIDDTLIHTPHQYFIISHAGHSAYDTRPIPCRHQGFTDIKENRRHSKQLLFYYEDPETSSKFCHDSEYGRILDGNSNWDHIIDETPFDYDDIVDNNISKF